MHDGTFPVERRAGALHRRRELNPHLDKEIHALDFLAFDERDDILAFPDSLSGTMPENLGPPPDLAAKQTSQNH